MKPLPLLLLLLTLAPPLRAADVSPATSAPAAASAARDLSSPKAAAKSLFNAISAGDRDGIRAALYASNGAQAELADAMADFITANKRLGDAARAQYGKAGDPIGRGMLDPMDLSRIDSATVKQSAEDAATLEVPSQPRPMSFRRQDGQWKLVVTDFGGAQPQNIARQTKLVSMLAGAVNECAADVAAGKFATPDAATAAIQSRLHGVLLAFAHPATTRAATQPATAPGATGGR